MLYSGGLMRHIFLMLTEAPLAKELIFRGICFERLREHVATVGAAFFCVFGSVSFMEIWFTESMDLPWACCLPWSMRHMAVLGPPSGSMQWQI